MASEALKRFLVERLLDLDSTLSDEVGSLMYSKVIDPLVVRLGVDPISVDVETFILARLLDEFPELDINSPGSVLRDVLVSPLVMLMEPLRREVHFLRTQNSLADAVALDDLEMDALLSNVLSERKYGSYARGSVRAYFNSARTLSVDSSIVFTTADGVNFYPSSPLTFFSEEFTRSGNFWFVDIPVRSSEANISANVPKNAIKFANGLDGLARVTNPSALSGGITEETNEDFLQRAERSLSERSLNTERGIETELYNNFTDLVSISVIGFGEPEMQRDIIEGVVDLDLTEHVGPLIYMTADWATVEVISGNLAGAFENGFPFTNTFVLNAPVGGFGAKEKTALLQAKYVTISDGNQYFDNPLLGRVRSIAAATEHPSGDIYVRTKDFDLYPKPLDIFSTGTSVPVLGTTNGVQHGLNRHSWQGSDFKLIGGNGDFDYVTGAHLPFTDHINTGFVFTDIPASVIPGRDFLVLASEEEFVGTGGVSEWSSKIRMFPLLRYFGNDDLGIGRSDGFMISKDRILYKGQADFTFDPNLEYSASRDHTHIKDFGGPKLSAMEDVIGSNIYSDVVYGGKEAEEYGRRPGVAIEGKKVNSINKFSCPTNAQITNAGAAQPQECDIVLHQSQSPWASRGITEGDFIACTVYTSKYGGEPYKGLLTTAGGALKWHAWGRVKKVGMASPWRLRVEGLDWRPLHKNNYLGFSGGNVATITLDSALTDLEWANVNLNGVSNGNTLGEGVDPWSGGTTTPGVTEARRMAAAWRLVSSNGVSILTGYISPTDENPNMDTPGASYPHGSTRDDWIDPNAAHSGTPGVWFTDIANSSWLTQVEDGDLPFDGGSDYRITAKATANHGQEYLVHTPVTDGMTLSTFMTNHQADMDAKVASREFPFIPMGTMTQYYEGNQDATWPATTAVGAPGAQIILRTELFSDLVANWNVEYSLEVNDGTGWAEHGTALDGLGFAQMSISGWNTEPAAPCTYAHANALVNSINNHPSNDSGGSPLVIASIQEGYASDGEGEVTVIVSSTVPGGGSASTWTVDFRPKAVDTDDWLDNHPADVVGEQVGYVHVSQWNGPLVKDGVISDEPVNNVNGGFIGGFGPRRQVLGLEVTNIGVTGVPYPAALALYNSALENSLDPTTVGYEALGEVVTTGGDPLAADPTFNIGTTEFIFSLNNTPLAEPTNTGDEPMVRITMLLDLPGPNQEGVSGYPETVKYLIAFRDDGNGGMDFDPDWQIDAGLIDVFGGWGHGGWLDTEKSSVNYATGTVKLAFKEDFELSWPEWAVWGFEWPAGTPHIGGPQSFDFTGGAANFAQPKFHAAYTYILNPYRAFWTVYKGMTELLTPEGHTVPSYDEFAFLPAHRRPDSDAPGYEPIHAAMPSGFVGDGWDSGTEKIFSNVFLDDDVGSNRCKMVWIRLGKPFNVVHPSIGGTPSEKCFTGEFVSLSGKQDNLPAGLAATNEYTGYTHLRYNQGQKSLDIGTSAFDDIVLVQPLSLPLVGGSTNISGVEENIPVIDTDDKPEPNEKGFSGFLIPHPMGSNYEMLGQPWHDPGAGDSPTEAGDKLEHQVVHMYEKLPDDFGEQLLTLSKIPGGVPFPGRFGQLLHVPNGSIHIGGLTDVYIKPATAIERTSENILIQPEEPIASYEEGGQIVFAGTDGIINCDVNQQHFDSPTLQAALSAIFGAPSRPLGNLVLEIIDPPSTEIKPTFFRILNTTATGVKIDGEFPSSLGLGFEQLKFRVLQECSTNLSQPLIILKQGDDLIIHKNEMAAFSPSGYTFAANPESATIYLHIDSDVGFGEYEVTGINLNTLVLNKAMSEEGMGLKYRIYQKQPSGLVMPLVRIKEVSLSGENEGARIPYRHPVDVVSSDFSGLNDDPIDEDTIGVTGGTLSVETVDLNLDGEIDTEPELEVAPIQRVCFTVSGEVNFVEYGTALYDVLRLDDAEPDSKYWYVEAVTSSAWPPDRWLDFSDAAVGNMPTSLFDVDATGSYLTTVDGSVPNPVDLTSVVKAEDLLYSPLAGQITATVNKVIFDVATGKSKVYFTGDFPDGVAGIKITYKQMGTNNRLVLDRLQDLPATIEGLRFTLGHPAIGTGRVYFKDRTFFEADPSTVFTYTDQKTEKEWYFRPSPAEMALVYKTGVGTTDIRFDKSDSDKKLTSEAVDFFKHNILPGDKLRIVSDVLWSRRFLEGLEEEKNLMVAGKTLAVSVNDSVRTCTFTGPNPMTLNDVVADLNRQLGDSLFADVFKYNLEEVGPPGEVEEVDGPGYRIRIFSPHDINLLTQGTIGILTDLGFENPSERDNTPDPQLIREYTVSNLEYVPAAGSILAKTKVTLTEESTVNSLQEYAVALPNNADTDNDGVWERYYDLVFIEIYREKNQRVYPKDLIEDDLGLYYADIKLTSFDPNSTTGIVPDEATLYATGYKSLGYEVVVSNENYSYSLGEDSSLKVTSVVLDDFDDSFDTVYEVAAAGVTIEYENSELVEEVQSHMLQPFTRVVCNNPLVRHYFPAYPMFSVTHNSPRSDTLVKEDLSDYMGTLYPNKAMEVSDLLGVLTRGGSSYISLPQEAAFLLYGPDRRIRVLRGKDKIFLGNQYHIMEDLSMVKVNGN